MAFSLLPRRSPARGSTSRRSLFGSRPSGPNVRGGKKDVDSVGDVLSRGFGLGNSDHMRNWRKQKREVMQKNRQEQRKLREDWKRREKEHVKDLEKSREDVFREYNVHMYEKKQDPRAERVRQKAEEKFKEVERERTRQFDRQKREAQRQLRYQRDQQVQNISKELRDQYRQAA
ncbi:MAG: hypothetical protein WEC84_03295 [Candidatus Andersenbacteria bacterium]